MSIQTEMLEIRERAKAMIEEGVNVTKQIETLNEEYANWVFTREPNSHKILANPIDNIFGKPIEV